MQQFVVPQFIDVEDKIFGPITTRQFVILLIAGIVIFLAYRFGDFALFITILAVVGGLALVFSFIKINGQAFHYFLLNIIQTLRRPSLRVWSKKFTNEELNYWRKQKVEEAEEVVFKKPIKSQHIRDLALIVNTGGFYRPEE
ncbi:MAG TPA: hypothetical protein DEB09_01900 [Candidatus Magasanikbacteria bacterium]|nr:hypothetical protein [Candidatus Magasanikbacteria bacterium]